MNNTETHDSELGTRNSALATRDFEPVIVAFCCHYCAFAAADLAGSLRLSYPPNVRIIRLPCTGKLDVLYILKAFEFGADGVMVAGCLEGQCHFQKGNIYAKKRVQYAKKLLSEITIEPERLEMYNLSSAMATRFAEIAREMTERIKKIGPTPIKVEPDKLTIELVNK
ncbi:MAG: hydrogenase iron-sulfur subunit [bacterium]